MKLLAGFLIIALLLLLMGLLSILVIGRMNQQVDRLIALETQTDLARQAIYSITAQSHYRAMALITQVDSWNDKIDTAKANFTADIDQIAALDAAIGPGVRSTICAASTLRFTRGGRRGAASSTRRATSTGPSRSTSPPNTRSPTNWKTS